MTQLRTGNKEACQGKKRFTSYYAAARSAKILNRYRDGAKANPYRCGGCKFWHVGNTMGDVKHRRRTRGKRGVQQYGGI